MLFTHHFECLDNQPSEPWAQLFLAHGAGAGWHHEWLNTMAQYLAEQGVWVRRLEFPYAQQMRETGKRRPPQPVAQLQDYFAELLFQQREEKLPCFVGGKSMGGRVATMLAAAEVPIAVNGVIAFGYPFHPVKKSENLRLTPLQQSRIPVLVVQGTRDAFGTKDDVLGYELGDNVELAWLEDGDHDFKPRKASGLTQPGLMKQAALAAASFMRSQLA